VALQDALARLNEPANSQVNWTFGDLLRARATRADWLKCPLLQQLETGADLTAWNELCRRTRDSLANEVDLQRKAESLLAPESPQFDVNLDDFLAEMLGAIYLAEILGHTNVTFPTENNITTDLISECNGISYVTEAKNLREPRSLAYVAFAQWNQSRAANPADFAFTADFLRIDDPFDDLTAEQDTGVRNLIIALPQRQRPSTFETTLPGGRRLLVRVTNGVGALIHQGPGPFLVDPVREACKRAVVIKMLDHLRKALTQLYAVRVPDNYRRLLFVRWKPPDQIGAIGEADEVRTALKNQYESFVRATFPNFALAILHTYEDLEDTPPATWQ
jgi:hypothetical protein